MCVLHRSEVATLDPALMAKCLRLAQSVACHSVFPYCESNHSMPAPRPICKTTCDAFTSGGLCERFLNEAEAPQLYARLTARCDARDYPAGSTPECIPISLETAQTGKRVP